MKIYFLTHNLRQDNGGGVFAKRLIEGVRDALGAEVVALTALPAGESYERPILEPKKSGVIARFFAVRAIVRDCDIVHALDAFPYGAFAAAASLGMRKKIIITAIGSGSILPLYQWRWTLLARWAYWRADQITAISAFTRGEILKKMPRLVIGVINPGVDAEDFAYATPSARDGAEHSAMKKFTPYILSVGQLRWRKGYHLSIRAFARVAAAFPDLHYVIVGKRQKDDYYHRVRALITELRLGERVHIVGDADTREELARWYRGAEMFCLFSQNVGHDVEGFGQVFLEAAAAGLAVVGSKNCGAEDAVRDGANGILVGTRSPDDFADALLVILNNPAKKKAMAEASLAFAAEMSWDKQIKKYVALYRDIISQE